MEFPLTIASLRLPIAQSFAAPSLATLALAALCAPAVAQTDDDTIIVTAQKENQTQVIRGGGKDVEGLLPSLADGVEGMEFISAAVASSRADGKWTKFSDV